MLTFFQYFSYSTYFTGILQYSARRRRRRNNLHASLKHKPTRRKCTGSRGRQVMSLIKIFPVSIRILFVFVHPLSLTPWIATSLLCAAITDQTLDRERFRCWSPLQFRVSDRRFELVGRRSDVQFRFLYVGIHLSLSLSLSKFRDNKRSIVSWFDDCYDSFPRYVLNYIISDDNK